MGKTHSGGGSDFWKNYDGTQEGQDFWEDYDMWEAMRQADEVAITREDEEALADAYDAELLDDIDGRLDIVDGQPALLNNIDIALEAGRDHSVLGGEHYSTTTARGNCRGCGQRYGHSIMCPVVNSKVTYINPTRVADAKAAFESREYKDWSRSNRGGSNASRGTKPTAVLVDMDGTIDDYGRPNTFGINYVRDMHEAGHVIVIGTARTHEHEYVRSHKWLCRELTHKYAIPFVGPFCRSRDDMRFACHFKAALIETLSGTYTFVGAIDDDRWCLTELRKIEGLEVVTAKPAVWDSGHWRNTRGYRGGAKKKNKHQKKEA